MDAPQAEATTDAPARTTPNRRRARRALIVLFAAALLLSWTFPTALHQTSYAFSLLAWFDFGIDVVSGPIGLATVTIAAPLLLIRKLRRTAAIACLLGLALSLQLLASQFTTRPAPASATIRVYCQNIFKGGRDPTLILAEIERTNPDVICFQEYNRDGHERLAANLLARYPFTIAAPTDHVRGTAIYSRLPLDLDHSSEFQFNDAGGPQLRVRLRIADCPVTLYCLHLAQPKRFSSFVRQRREVAELLSRLDTEAAPTIVLGDLNAPNGTYVDELLRSRDYADTSCIVAGGLQWTWPSGAAVPWFRLLRLDHVYLSRELSASHAEVGRYAGADHRPVIADVGFKASD